MCALIRRSDSPESLEHLGYAKGLFLNPLYTRARGPEQQKKSEWLENLHGTKWITIYVPLNIALGTSKRGGSYTKLGSLAIKLNCHWFLEILYCHVGEPNPYICYGPSTWSLLHIKLEAHQLQNWNSISYGMHNLWMTFKSP